jgi:hypothetical protein
MATYRIVEGPTHVEAPDTTLLTGYYRAVFEGDGARHTRYLTDKGRAEVIRRQDDGEDSFTSEDLQRVSVDPDLRSVLERYDAEAGEGA